MLRRFKLFYIFCILFTLNPSFGTVISSQVHALVTVSSDCQLSTTPLSFGGYDPLSNTPNDATNTINVLCTLTTPYHIRLDRGVYGSSVTTRQLGNGAARLNYELMRDAGRTLNWGETDSIDTVESTGTGGAQAFAVYGRIPALQAVTAGSYSDTITVTVSF